MKNTSSIRVTFIIVSLIILLSYFSEMDLIRGYSSSPDKIYLAVWMLILYPVLFFILIRTIAKCKVKSEKIEILASTVLTILGFAMLNDPKGNAQAAGYLIVLTIWVVAVIRFVLIRRRNSLP